MRALLGLGGGNGGLLVRTPCSPKHALGFQTLIASTVTCPMSAFAGKIAEMWTEELLGYLKQSTAKESHFEDASALKQQHLPKRIYKYRRGTAQDRENLKSSTNVNSFHPYTGHTALLKVNPSNSDASLR
jgi:hypothetical protein